MRHSVCYQISADKLLIDDCKLLVFFLLRFNPCGSAVGTKLWSILLSRQTCGFERKTIFCLNTHLALICICIQLWVRACVWRQCRRFKRKRSRIVFTPPEFLYTWRLLLKLWSHTWLTHLDGPPRNDYTSEHMHISPISHQHHVSLTANV